MSVKISYIIYNESQPVTVGIAVGNMPNISYSELGKLIEDLTDIKREMWKAMHQPAK